MYTPFVVSIFLWCFGIKVHISVFIDRWQEIFGNNAIIELCTAGGGAVHSRGCARMNETWSGIDCDGCRYVDKIHTPPKC